MKSKAYDVVLLLGIELLPDDSPSDEMRLRVDTAVKHCKDSPPPMLIASGGALPGHTTSEASVMEELLIESGIPKQIIHTESLSQNTAENIRNSKALFHLAKSHRILIITSDYHALRSKLTARAEGLRADVLSVPVSHPFKTDLMELCYIFDLLMGWQKEGASRPQWCYKVFDMIFAKRDQT